MTPTRRALEARIAKLERLLETPSERQARALGYPSKATAPEAGQTASDAAGRKLRGDS